MGTTKSSLQQVQGYNGFSNLNGYIDNLNGKIGHFGGQVDARSDLDSLTKKQDMHVFVKSENKWVRYSGTSWVDISSSGTVSTDLNGLTDVVIVAPSNNQVLVYDTSLTPDAWTNKSLGTSAFKNVGTASGNVPELNVSGKLDSSVYDFGTSSSTQVAPGNHTHSSATTSAAGFMSAADKTKLEGIATGANNYVHPTGDGNRHVPATGTGNNGKFLKVNTTTDGGQPTWEKVGISDVNDLQTTLNGKENTISAGDGINKNDSTLSVKLNVTDSGLLVDSNGLKVNLASSTTNDTTTNSGLKIINQTSPNVTGIALNMAAVRNRGNSSITFGEFSNTEGFNSIAYGDNSHTEGQKTIAVNGVILPPICRKLKNVKCATTQELSNFSTLISDVGVSSISNIDGVSLSVGDRMLIKNQTTNKKQNGIYVVESIVNSLNKKLARTVDAFNDGDLQSGDYVYVESGTLNGTKNYFITTNNPIKINSLNTPSEDVNSSEVEWDDFDISNSIIFNNQIPKNIFDNNSFVILLDKSGINYVTKIVSHNETKRTITVNTTGIPNSISTNNEFNVNKVILISKGNRKQDVDLVSTSDISISSFAKTTLIDNTVVLLDNRVLLTNQSNTTQNGIYVVSDKDTNNYQLTRASDADTNVDFNQGDFVFVSNGVVHKNKFFFLENESVTLDSTSITWTSMDSLPNYDNKNQHSEGEGTISIGDSSHAEGVNSVAIGYASHAEGADSIASGNASHVEGYFNIASGDYSHAEGKESVAFGQSSHAEGELCEASGNMSHAEGSSTTSSGAASHAEGADTLAFGHASHSEGFSTYAYGNFSHAEGNKTAAYGVAAHAEGESTLAYADFSRAEGYCSVAASGIMYDVYSVDYANDINSTLTIKTLSLNTSSVVLNRRFVLTFKPTTPRAPMVVVGSTTISIETITINGVSSELKVFSVKNLDGTNILDNFYNFIFDKVIILDENDFGASASGAFNISLGKYSTANGFQTYSIGDYSNTFGVGTYAKHSQFVVGRYNKYFNYDQNSQPPGVRQETINTLKSSIFIVGNGYGLEDSQRSNAFRVDHGGSGTMIQTIENNTLNNNNPTTTTLATNANVHASMGYSAGSNADYAEMFEWSDGNVENEDRRGYFVTIDGESDKIRIANDSDDYILGVVSTTPALIGDSAEMEWSGKTLKNEWGQDIYEAIVIPAQYNQIHHPAVYEQKITIDDDGNETIEDVLVKESYIEDVLISPESITYQPKLNPNYDASIEYIPRSERKEWAVVGMLGKIYVRDDGTCTVGGYCKPNADGVATKTNSGYRVIQRKSESVVRIIFR